MNSNGEAQKPKKLEADNQGDAEKNAIVADDEYGYDEYGDDEIICLRDSGANRHNKSRFVEHVVYAKASSNIDKKSSFKNDKTILCDKQVSHTHKSKKYTNGGLFTYSSQESPSPLISDPLSNHHFMHITSNPGPSNLDTFHDLSIATDLHNNAPSVVLFDQLNRQHVSMASTASSGNYSIGSLSGQNRQGVENGSRKPSRRRSSLTTTTNRLLQPIMDHQGHAMSEEEMKAHWKNMGKCDICGTVTTHRKEKFGPFGSLRRIVPQTLEGYSYKGYCLHCYDVPELRELLRDPDIPLDLERNVAFLNPEQFSVSTNDLFMTEKKESKLTKLFSTIQCQLCCGAILLCLAGAVVAMGIILSDDAEPWISHPPSIAPSTAQTSIFPTSSPTSWEWQVSSKISTDIHSFGFKVKLSNDGTVLAVSSPDYENGQGRFDVYYLNESQDEKRWLPMKTASITKEVLRNQTYMGMGMQISRDGSTIAIGSPGYEEGRGRVQTFNIDKVNLILSEKGEAVVGPVAMCEFGYSVALNYDGTRLFVGAPNYHLTKSQVTGLVQAFNYDRTSQTWIQVGSDMIGRSNGDHFGYSLDTTSLGDVVLIGAPYSSDSFRNAGSIYFYILDSNNRWYHFPTNHADGSSIGSHMGKSLASNKDGTVIITNNYDGSIEDFPGAGLIHIWAEDENFINTVGFPISGTSNDYGLGFDVDISGDGALLLASGENNLVHAGSVLVFSFGIGEYVVFGKEMMGPPLGTCKWFGKGPSVSIAADTLRLAIGYECVMENGISKSEVRIFDYLVG
jgi:hypothetical protein